MYLHWSRIMSVSDDRWSKQTEHWKTNLFKKLLTTAKIVHLFKSSLTFDSTILQRSAELYHTFSSRDEMSSFGL